MWESSFVVCYEWKLATEMHLFYIACRFQTLANIYFQNIEFSVALSNFWLHYLYFFLVLPSIPSTMLPRLHTLSFCFSCFQFVLWILKSSFIILPPRNFSCLRLIADLFLFLFYEYLISSIKYASVDITTYFFIFLI